MYLAPIPDTDEWDDLFFDILSEVQTTFSSLIARKRALDRASTWACHMRWSGLRADRQPYADLYRQLSSAASGAEVILGEW